jgi:hypothetical protein
MIGALMVSVSTYTPPRCEKKQAVQKRVQRGGCNGAQLGCVKTPVGKATSSKEKAGGKTVATGVVRNCM